MGADEALKSSRTVPATVVGELPRNLFRVVLENQEEVLAHPVGTVKRNFVRLLPGDLVEVELMPHDWTRGRIVRRTKSRSEKSR